MAKGYPVVAEELGKIFCYRSTLAKDYNASSPEGEQIVANLAQFLSNIRNIDPFDLFRRLMASKFRKIYKNFRVLKFP